MNAKIEAVLTFNPADFDEEDELHKCPILLSFMCLLVREDDFDLANNAIHVGEIYTRMVRCLYKKFTIRKEIHFENDNFIKAMAAIGKLALETLLSGNPLLRRSDVMNEVGKDAFDFGLLIGNEDAHRLIRDETADIFVTFPHRSLQEFLGAFYFVWMLAQGELLESLLGADSKPIFMTNPLFLQFCLWFCADQDYFHFGNKDDVYQCLKSRCLKSMRQSVLNIALIARKYPALDIQTAYNKDKLWLKFLGEILVDCDTTSILAVSIFDPLQWFLRSMGPALKTVTCLRQDGYLSYFYGNDVIVNLHIVSWDEINMVVDHFTQFVDNPQIHLYLHEPRDLQDKICAERIKKLYIKCPQSIPNYSILLPLNPHLTHICKEDMSNSETMQGWLFHLSEATKSGALSCLSHLSFTNCNGVKGNLHKLFAWIWQELRFLNLLRTALDATDLKFLCSACNGTEKILPKLTALCLFLSDDLEINAAGTKLFGLPWMQLRQLCLQYSPKNKAIHTWLCSALNENGLQNLCTLSILHNFGEHDSEPLLTDKVYNVEFLVLCECLLGDTVRNGSFKCSEMVIYSKRITSTDSLNVESFPFLKSLSYIKGDLGDKPIKNLVKANRKGQLSELRHLHISDLAQYQFNSLFDEGCTWNNLLTLTAATETESIIYYVQGEHAYPNYLPEAIIKRFSACLSSVQELGAEGFQVENTRLNHLKKLYLDYWMEADQKNIADAVDKGLLPALQTVCFGYFSPEGDSLCRLSDKGVSFHQRIPPEDDPFTTLICVCQQESFQDMSVYLNTDRIRSLEAQNEEN